MKWIYANWKQWLGSDLVLAVVALGMGIGGALLGTSYLSARASAAEAELAGRYETQQVVVASTDLRQGDMLDGGNLAVREVPRQFVPADSVPVERAGELLGGRVAIDVGRGTPIMKAALLASATVPRLSAALSLDERALTVAVDDLKSQAGALRSGDRIDLYFSAQESGDALLLPLLQQVEILAIGDSVSRPDADGGAMSQFSTVTLRVSAADVARVLLAQQAGELSLVLRPPGDHAQEPARIRSSRELLALPAPVRSASAAVELLVGGNDGGHPTRSWIRVGSAIPERAQ